MSGAFKQAFDDASDAYDAAGDSFENGELLEALDYGVQFIRHVTRMLHLQATEPAQQDRQGTA